jgi:hypothetical protein
MCKTVDKSNMLSNFLFDDRLQAVVASVHIRSVLYVCATSLPNDTPFETSVSEIRLYSSIAFVLEALLQDKRCSEHLPLPLTILAQILSCLW